MVQLGVEQAVALVDGRGGSDRPWAPGYPDDGALVASGFVMTAAQHGRDLGPYGTYEIIRRSDGRVIGAAGFTGQPDETGAVRVGYGLAESARGAGYATEALKALLQWARGQDGLTCVLADTTKTNVASQKVMERAGMQRIAEDAYLLYDMAERASHRPALPRCRGMSAVVLPPFWSLVEAHGDELLAHARRMTDDQSAEGVLQDALLRALRAYPRLRHADHLRAWLYRVTTTTALDLHRRRRREVPTEEPPAPAVEAEYDDGAFESLIAPLARTARDALRLRFVDDLDYDRIAIALGTSPEAARQRVSTAVRTLRERVTA